VAAADPARALAERIAAPYATLPGVVAVALAGSRGAGRADPSSDVDLYVYASPPLALEARAAVAREGAARAEVGNDFFEPGDEWVDAASGVHLDAMFREPRWIEGELEATLDRCQARVGWSTCLWANVLRSEALADAGGWYGRLQERARRPYPEALRRAVVAKNHPLLRANASSYAVQLARAEARGDAVSLVHRSSALLASFFDVLFALNREPHPGEKRLVAIAQGLPLAPPDLGARVAALARAAADGQGTRAAVDALCEPLDALARGEGLA